MGGPRGVLRGLSLLVLLAALTGAAYGALYGLLYAMKGVSPFWAEAWRQLFQSPTNPSRQLTALAGVFVVVAALLTPIAWAETRAVKRFARREEELRRERPLDVLTPYSGEEGEGVAFDGPEGRLLLLRPERGLGEPREVHLVPESPSPMGSNGPPADL